MKKSIAFMCIGMLLCSAAVSAAPSTEVKVSGKVTPAACSLEIGNRGYVVYGLIASASINKTSNTTLPTQSASFSITCDQPIRIALSFTDNRAGSKVPGLFRYTNAAYSGWYGDQAMYGLGTVGNKNIGAFQLGLANVRHDRGNTYGLISTSSAADAHWGYNSTNLLAAGEWYGWGGSTVAPLKTITGELTVTPVLEQGQNLPTGEEINFDGSVTMEVRYL
ncbi:MULTISPECIES: DUF1120 domain-containing protein [unclassified Herbaspirillum]|uniref:DUF1120 domain-containing protein n=1 Tax=unclassified Herbaspirillum TaxID=2624150 RepID=UPI00116CCC92|nr:MULTISPECIES: DUF1120 domain-containing protein [unclassified Herbaspirillum]MBB5392709.1 type 1 fimbria pilin [Herbaspirillum sp. SJZ102]TQK06344.1 uncharacterized protein DUF1120 [Herbaspirillum sp. SJZ130]TQK12178.1 uncharacterized protein DUF1120 [Herbaspirillum sp. SJZ106]